MAKPVQRRDSRRETFPLPAIVNIIRNALDFKGEVEGALGYPWDCDGWLTGYFFRHTARFLRIIKNQLLAF